VIARSVGLQLRVVIDQLVVTASRASRAAVCAVLIATAFPAAASAQVYIGSPAPNLGSWEVSGGAVWSDGYGLGTRSAELTRNTGTGTAPFEQFTANTRVDTVTGGQGRLGFYLSRSVALEAGVQFSRPVVSSRLTNDVEEAADTTATETMSRYVIDGSIVFHLTGLSFAGGKGVPFLTGGGGYIRELHEREELIETGRTYHGGAGLKLWFGQGRRRLGLRADVGVAMRDGAFDYRDGQRTFPTAGISLTYLF
jgi:hypothetical protein